MGFFVAPGVSDPDGAADGAADGDVEPPGRVAPALGVGVPVLPLGSSPAARSDVVIASPSEVPPRARRSARAESTAPRSVVGGTRIAGSVEKVTSPTLKVDGS